MANNTCVGSIQACMIRTALLNSNGAPTGGANSGYISDAVIEVGVNVVVSEGEVKELRNGCDAICQTLSNPDRIQRVDLTMTLCQLDAELIQQMTGGTLITDGGDTIGVKLPTPTDDISGFGISFEVWSKAWNGDAAADDGSNALYHHFVFPKTVWTPGNFSLNGDFLEFPMSGKASVNTSFYDGPADDLPVNMNGLAGWFLDDTLPDAQCGYVTYPAGS